MFSMKHALMGLLAIGGLSSVSQAAGPRFANIIIDHSASMNTKRTQGPGTRCRGAHEIALESAQEFFRAGGEAVNVYAFGAAGELVSLTNGFESERYDVYSAITDPENQKCRAGATALAQTVCNTIDDLRRYAATHNMQDGDSLAMLIMTDGYENASPPSECGNDSSRNRNWKEKVQAKLTSEGDQVLFNAGFFTGSVESSGNSLVTQDHKALADMTKIKAYNSQGIAIDAPDNKPLPYDQIENLWPDIKPEPTQCSDCEPDDIFCQAIHC